jgi:hypothetical protein
VKLDGFRNYLYETMNKKFEPFQFFLGVRGFIWSVHGDLTFETSLYPLIRFGATSSLLACPSSLTLAVGAPYHLAAAVPASAPAV